MLHTTKPADYIPAEKLADPRTVPIAAHSLFYRSVSSTSRTIPSKARCTKASSGHVPIVASSRLKPLSSWASANDPTHRHDRALRAACCRTSPA
jgi:hypothetical protein